MASVVRPLAWLAFVSACVTTPRLGTSSSSEGAPRSAAGPEPSVATLEQKKPGSASAAAAIDAGTERPPSVARFPFDFREDLFGPDSGIGEPEPGSKGLGIIEPPLYPLVIWLKPPYVASARQLVFATKLRFFGEPSSGSLSTIITAQELRESFGLNVTRWTDKNAGNRIGADSHRFRIEDKRLLKPGLRRLVRDIELNDDPKRELYDEDPEYTPQ